MKKVIAACIDQILQFDSEHEIDAYIEDLKKKKQHFRLVWKNNLPNGTVQIRIKKQYNNNGFLEGGEQLNDEQK